MIEIGDKYIIEVTGKLECQNVDKNGKHIDSRKTAYEKGLNDAWEAAAKIFFEREDGGFSRDELFDIFGTYYISHIFAGNSAAEVISKIETYEEKKKEKAKKAQPGTSGKWIDTGNGMKCSECGKIQYGYDNYRHYCANCGARMEGNAGGGRK